jgi:hypothetical protein
MNKQPKLSLAGSVAVDFIHGMFWCFFALFVFYSAYDLS